jgi:hypothetical protein
VTSPRLQQNKGKGQHTTRQTNQIARQKQELSTASVRVLNLLPSDVPGRQPQTIATYFSNSNEGWCCTAMQQP